MKDIRLIAVTKHRISGLKDAKKSLKDNYTKENARLIKQIAELEKKLKGFESQD
jgi:hypothetical protein